MSYGQPDPWLLYLYYGKNCRPNCTPGELAISCWDRSNSWRDAMDFHAGVRRSDIGRIEVGGSGMPTQIVWQELPARM